MIPHHKYNQKGHGGNLVLETQHPARGRGVGHFCFLNLNLAAARHYQPPINRSSQIGCCVANSRLHTNDQLLALCAAAMRSPVAVSRLGRRWVARRPIRRCPCPDCAKLVSPAAGAASSDRAKAGHFSRRPGWVRNGALGLAADALRRSDGAQRDAAAPIAGDGSGSGKPILPACSHRSRRSWRASIRWP